MESAYRKFWSWKFFGLRPSTGKKGLIPDGSFYDKKNTFRWNASTNISNAIGQGEIITTPYN